MPRWASTPARTAELAPLEPGVFEMTLPGTPGMNVYRQLPSAADVDRMAAAIDRLRAERRIAVGRGRGAIALLDRPGRETPRAVRLAGRLRLHGRPLRASRRTAATMLQAEERTIAAADLVVVTSEVLHEKVAAEGPADGADPQRAATTSILPDRSRWRPSPRSGASAATARSPNGSADRRLLRRDCRMVRRRPGGRLGRVAARLEVRADRQHVHRRRDPAGEAAERDAAGREALCRVAAADGRLGLLHHPLQADSADRGHQSGEGLRDAGHRQAGGGGGPAGVAADGPRRPALAGRRCPRVRRGDRAGAGRRRSGPQRRPPPGLRRRQHVARPVRRLRRGRCASCFRWPRSSSSPTTTSR